ncbi:response regulator [Mesorhizobium sp. ESP-6-4]|uniref:response regulator n=1 Tax=Mesorhizobium sp. ESP-6-4 TaxID=2876624 RepID=UPI001CCB619E|nr:response regulator [Mesorhizobium sp. ESP-6-4]MBZ9658210.1 response regulator [Mesorhizobium sp. ESP-6-4]
MLNLLSQHEFWTAITSLAWPVIALFALYKFLPTIDGLLKRDSVSVKIAGFELNSQQVVDDIRKSISDIQKRILEIEGNGDLDNRTIFERNENIEFYASQEISKTLLWVDDFPSNNAFLIDEFRKGGVDVVLSLSTDDAVKRLENESFFAIITDLGRKEDGIDNPGAGLDLIRIVKNRNIEVPILVFAGPRGISKRAQLIDAGAEVVTQSGVDVIKFVNKYARK